MRYCKRLRTAYPLLYFLIFAHNLSAQSQKGLDIEGKSRFEKAGYSISMPDATTIAIGIPGMQIDSLSTGGIRVYQWKGAKWTQKGLDIKGNKGDQYDRCLGSSVCMPDANTVAIGAPYTSKNGLYNSGAVYIYHWIDDSWKQLGDCISDNHYSARLGWSVSMPNANTIAIGAPYDRNFDAAGYVSVYIWKNNSWQKKGRDLVGVSKGDYFGYSISMPDPNTIAVGASLNDYCGTNSGMVEVYRWTGSSWTRKGSAICGEHAYDQSGYSISMPDSNTLAIGAPDNDARLDNAGAVHIYSWDGSTWKTKGKPITGEKKGAAFGCALSMPTANTLAVSSSRSDFISFVPLQASVYSWSGTQWVKKEDLIGVNQESKWSGSSINMPNATIVAVGVPNTFAIDSNKQFIGNVRIFDLSK